MQINNDAIAYVNGGSIKGRVEFQQRTGSVIVTANIKGLPPDGFFAFHIHEGNSCAGEGFAKTGGHYNPTKEPHPRHAGDLPPLLSCKGNAYMSVLTDRFTVKDIIGKTIVIHSGPDDFKSQPAGNAGTKIACGEITKKSPSTKSR